MPPETWLVLTVAAAFLLLGIAASPLAWVALLQRRSRSDRQMERRFHELTARLHDLQVRLERCESSSRTRAGSGKTLPVVSTREWPITASTPLAGSGPGRTTFPSAAIADESPLITVPNLASTSQDRQATQGSLAQRYAAIWTLADSGTSPEVIARATGQPIGQIELILGLRRQIDGARTTRPHASHE
ncbi:MAG TPA: hypothetical protein VFF52_03815 [Isosphaeraceae bacterium]|nr:hypothetical protein [Isosphaeraceae bacterium]